MHAPAIKRMTLNRGIGLALGVALVASVTLNVALFTRSNDGAAQPAETIAQTQRSSSLSTTGEIDVDRFLATQSAARAARSGYATSATGHVDVLQLLAEQRSASSATSRQTTSTAGQIDVDQWLADQSATPAPQSWSDGMTHAESRLGRIQANRNATLAAGERFMEAKFDRMAAGH